ncbi:MAG: hypothetical protein OHK0039_38880 [Bacteroidia bacterium]
MLAPITHFRTMLWITCWLLGVLVPQLYPGDLQAKTVYVSPSGNDQNPGTQQAPMRTLAQALQAAGTSGHIILAAGTYREGNINVPISGTADAPVIIEGMGEEQTFIRGSLEVTNWVQHAPGIWKRTGWTTNSQQVFSDGMHLQQIGIRSPWHTKMLWNNQPTLPPVGEGVGDLFPGSFYHDGATSTLYVMLADSGNPNDHLMEASTVRFILHGNTRRHVTLRNLTLGHTNGTHDGGKGMVMELGAANWTLENCTLEYGDFACITAIGINHVIRNCNIRYGGDLGIEMNNSDGAHGWAYYNTAPNQNTLIEGCTFSHHNYRNFDASWHSGGMKLIPANRGVTVRGNTLTNINGPAIWFDHPLGENVIESNYIENCQIGIFYELSENESTVAFAGRICNNTVVNTSLQGIYVSASSGVEVTRNTVAGCWVGIVMHGMPRGNFQLRDNDIHDNIILGGSHADMILYQGTGSGGNQVNNNFFVTGVALSPTATPRTGIRVGVVTGGGYGVNHFSVSSLAASTPYEHDGASGNPLWTDPHNFDFSLQGASPARGKGAEDVCCCSALQGFNPFPVELLNFGAVPQPAGQQVLLHWQTASERNNAGFIVERSHDGVMYQPYLPVAAQGGNSSEVRSYEAFDTSPLTGVSYYRLRQEDFDGAFTYFPAVEVRYEPQHLPSLLTRGVYGVQDPLVFALLAPGGTAAQLFIQSLTGQRVWEAAHPAGQVRQEYSLGSGALVPGFYLIGIAGHPELSQRICITR